MTKSGIRLVCFDLGGVIVRTCSSWEQACARAGLPVHPQADTPEAEARIRAADEGHQVGLLSEDDYFREVAAATGGSYTVAETALIHEAWLLGEYRGMAGIVAELNARVRTACLSNTNPPHWDLMIRNGRTELIPLLPSGFEPAAFPGFHLLGQREASHLLGLAKPSPQIYAAFEARSGFTGSEILFFDDREDNVAAAREAGWRAETVRLDTEPDDQIREYLRRWGA